MGIRRPEGGAEASQSDACSDSCNGFFIGAKNHAIRYRLFYSHWICHLLPGLSLRGWRSQAGEDLFLLTQFRTVKEIMVWRLVLL
ncbi:hypothetical protein J6590_048568 [Homalodisca vitripennis]|nr:hypothetical protein J6590_048568 [Homalodisca vitripennis]